VILAYAPSSDYHLRWYAKAIRNGNRCDSGGVLAWTENHRLFFEFRDRNRTAKD